MERRRSPKMKNFIANEVYVLLVFSLTAAATGTDCVCDNENHAVDCSSLLLINFNDEDIDCGHFLFKIDLSVNFLDAIPNAVRHFSILDLSFNLLLVRLSAGTSQKVEDLKASNCMLTEIDLEDNFPSLRKLLVARNQLGVSDDDFLQGHCNIEHLDVSENKIKSLQSVTRCTQLTVLLASKNMVSELPENLLALTKLEMLDLSMNELQYVSGLPTTLETLDLSGNEFTRINVSTFKNLKSLQLVDLSNNKISAVDENAFAYLSSLKTLILSGNKLKVLTRETFRGLRSLKVINLRRNYIVTVYDDAFSDLPALEELNLDENLLTTLPALQLGRSVSAVSFTFNFIRKLNLSSLATIASGNNVTRTVIFPLNYIRGDDPEWVPVMLNFEWACLDDWVPLVVGKLSAGDLQSRYKSHKIVHNACPCASFKKDNWQFGTCVSDAGEINGLPWLTALELSARYLVNSW